MEISLSILSIDYNNIHQSLSPLLKDLRYLHLDIMDGHFVPNISFGPALVQSLKKNYDLIFDTHLMVENPEDFIEKFVIAGSDYITFHIEATSDPRKMIDLIHNYGIKAGIAVKPYTDIETIEEFLPYLDLVLVMSVDPGFSGQAFIPSVISKLVYLKKQKMAKGYTYLVNIDGGINLEVLPPIKEYLDLAVSGSYVVNSKTPLDNLRRLKNI